MDLTVELRIDREEAEALPYEKLTPLTAIKVQSRGGLQPANFVDPVSVIVAVAAAAIVERIVDTWLRSKQRGAMIDLSGDNPVISRIAGVPEGTLLLINRDGSREIRQFDYKHRSTFMENLSSILEGAS